MEGIQYATLSGENAETMAAKLKAVNGTVIPHPKLSSIEVAIKDGKIIGYGVSQFMFHAEPIFVDKEHRGTGIAEELANRVIKRILECNGKAFVAIATNEFSEKLCRSQGMSEVPGKLFVKVL